MIITPTDKIEPYEDISEIFIPFPEKKYNKLLKICNLNKNSNLGPHQMTQVFVNTIYHFLQGHLSQDELSSIANSLWVDIKGTTEQKFNELGSVLYAASEMSFYIRRIYSKDGKHGGFEGWMIKVMEFYLKNRKVVVKSEEKKI